MYIANICRRHSGEPMDQAMTQAEEIRQLKRQLKKAQTVANAAERERDGALKNLGRADAKLNDNAKQIMYLQRQRKALVALSNGYGLLGTDHDTMWSHVSELDRIIKTPNC
jgi:chromosome segregation ATPase